MAFDASAGWSREGGLTPQQRRMFQNQWRMRQLQAEEQEDAPQNAQNAAGGQNAPAPAQAPVQPNEPPGVAQRAQDERALQAARLGGMIDRVEQAHRDENDSRVAQAREARRMEFAKDIERMRQEALLQRLAMEQQSQPSYAHPPSGHMRVFNPNTLSWDYTDSVTFGG